MFPHKRLTQFVLALTLCAISARAQGTFSGRVTDNTSGQGVSGAAVVMVGNQTGTRVAISDSVGNYSLPYGWNTSIELRAYKQPYIFSPILVSLSSPGGFPIFGPITQNFQGTILPIQILIFPLPPVLLTEDSSLNALTLDDELHLRDPFSTASNNYFGSDQRTRLSLLLVDLDLYESQGETLSVISAQARDAQFKSYALPVEDLRKVPGVPWMSQLTVRLPTELSGLSEITVTVAARGQISNAAKIRLK